MADVTIAANGVLWVSGPKTVIQVGAAVTPGLVVYTDATGRAQLALNDTQPHAAAVGLTLGTAANNQYVVIAQSGAQVTIGAANAVVKGGCYHVSANSGAVAPEADFNTGQWITVLGRAPNITDLVLELNAYNYQHG